MLRSMYSGVSGLKAHQVKLDVIGNNIANVNTFGYKSSRVTFKEMLTQTLRGASRPSEGRGGLNPMQVGLGVGLGSIDIDFTDGLSQPTGRPLDIALEGNGFFVVSDGNRNYFTRAGAFGRDPVDNIVHGATGLKLMGWMADENGVLDINSSNMVPLSLNGLTMTPKASTNIKYKGNLDSNKKIVDLSYGPESMTITDVNGKTAKLYIELDKVFGGSTPDRADDQWTWSAFTDIPTTTNNVNVTHGVSEYIDALICQPAAPGNPPKPFQKVLEGSVVVTDTTGATIYTEGVDYTIDYSNGTITTLAAGAINDSNDVKVDWTYNTKVSDGNITLDKTGAILSNSTATFQIPLHSPGFPSTNVTVQAPQAGQENGGFFEVTTPGVTADTIDGEYGPMRTTSHYIYDSKGNQHKINLNFVKTDSNRWDWFADGPVDQNGVPYPLTGNSGTVIFDSQGKLMGTPTGGPISFKPFEAEQLVITPDFTVLTSYAAEDGKDTAEAYHTDGYEAGSLASFEIDVTGTITGTYTNDMRQPVAKIAVAIFNNAYGLNRAGDTIFTESNNSGTPSYGISGVGGRAEIAPNSVEMSNVDLAEQFTEMITAQRGFQANSKIISTADQVLQDLVNMKR